MDICLCQFLMTPNFSVPIPNVKLQKIKDLCDLTHLKGGENTPGVDCSLSG